MTNVFKIRHGKETHVYRTEVPADKKVLLSQFRQVAEELAARKRREREGEHERRKTIWAGGGGDVRPLLHTPQRITCKPNYLMETAFCIIGRASSCARMDGGVFAEVT